MYTSGAATVCPPGDDSAIIGLRVSKRMAADFRPVPFPGAGSGAHRERMKVLPPRVARPSPPDSQPSGPARWAPEDAPPPPAAPSWAKRAPGGTLEAGVLVVALAGLALASTAGREPRGLGALLFSVVLA